MKSLFSSLLLFISVLVGCAQDRSPVTPKAQDVQEGIGGDLAALYVKAIGFGCISESESPDDWSSRDKRLDYVSKLESTRIHSSTHPLPHLFEFKGNVLMVDREKLMNTSQEEVARQLLALMGFEDLQSIIDARALALKSSDFTVDDAGLALHSSRATKILKKLESSPYMFASRAYAESPRFNVQGEGSLMSIDKGLRTVAGALPHMDFRLTDSILIDVHTKHQVDAIAKKINGVRTVYLSRPRLKTAGSLTSLLPILMIHETSNLYARAQSGDDETYTFTMRVFAGSLQYM